MHVRGGLAAAAQHMPAAAAMRPDLRCRTAGSVGPPAALGGSCGQAGSGLAQGP